MMFHKTLPQLPSSLLNQPSAMETLWERSVAAAQQVQPVGVSYFSFNFQDNESLGLYRWFYALECFYDKAHKEFGEGSLGNEYFGRGWLPRFSERPLKVFGDTGPYQRQYQFEGAAGRFACRVA